MQEDKRELAKNLRDQAKDAEKKLRENYFYETTEKCWKNWNFAGGRCRTDLSDPAVYRDIFEKKRQKNIVDFTDMEHFALEILVKKEALIPAYPGSG